MILTTRQRAAGGDIVNSDQPVYEIVLRGSFICGQCSVPAGATAPRGTILTLTLDRTTFRVTDFGIGDVAPRLLAGDHEIHIAF